MILEPHEAQGVLSLLIDGMTCQRELDLGEDALLGLHVILRAVRTSLDRVDGLQHG